MRRFALLIGFTSLLVGLAVLLRVHFSGVSPSGASSQAASTTNQRIVVTASASSTSSLGFATGSARPIDAQNARKAEGPSAVGLEKSTRIAESTPDETQVLLPEVLALLERPDHRPLMKEVPQLGEATQRELVRRYHEIPDFTNKNHIVRILAFRGDPVVVRPLLIRAVTKEFVDRELDRLEDAQLGYVLQLLGLVAARDDECLAFLFARATVESWVGKPLWRIRDHDGKVAPVSPHILASNAIQGLGMSGRPEVAEWFAEIRDGRHTDLDQLPGSVVTAAFLWTAGHNRGLEFVMDKVVYTPESFALPYQEWKQTTEGTQWDQWYASWKHTRR